MEAKLYYLTNNLSLRKVRAYLIENGIAYRQQRMSKEALTWDQLVEILSYTENGIEDILSTRSNSYVELTRKGVDFEDITLREFYELLTEHPSLLRSPILVAKNNTLIGFNEGEISVLLPKSVRKQAHQEILFAMNSGAVYHGYLDF